MIIRSAYTYFMQLYLSPQPFFEGIFSELFYGTKKKKLCILYAANLNCKRFCLDLDTTQDFCPHLRFTEPNHAAGDRNREYSFDSKLNRFS